MSDIASSTETVAPASGKQPVRLHSIDALRGAAALAVATLHSLPHALPQDTASALQQGVHPLQAVPPEPLWFATMRLILSHGYLGVPLFFVLSGFCIHLRWTKNFTTTGEKKVHFPSFWKRRILRLYPPYFVVLCITMSLMVIAFLQGRADIYPQPKIPWMAADFFTHVFMLHGLHPIFDQGAGNPPMWTLAREEYFYLMYFVLLAWRHRWGLKHSIAVVFVLGLVFPLAMRAFVPAGSDWWRIIYSSAITLWIQWSLGMVAVEAYYGVIQLPRWCRSLWMVPVWFALGKLSMIYLPQLTPVLWGMTFFTLLNFCVCLEKSNRWPQNRFMAWLSGVGVFSYSLYLLHNPTINIIGRFLGPLSSTNPWLMLLGMIIKVGACYGAAWIFFLVVERHFLHAPLTSKRPQTAPSDTPSSV